VNPQDHSEKAVQLERVFLFGDKLSFLIPRTFVESEEEEDDHCLYQEPDTDSGWLRVSLITSKDVDRDPAERLRKFFGSKKNVYNEERTGNLVSVFEKDSEQDGDSIHLYYWAVGNVIPPDAICEALFSYTVLSERVRDFNTTRMVKLLGELVSKAEFAPAGVK
jgi:hypothetical protein